MNTEISQFDLVKFREWLGLPEQKLTWSGKYFESYQKFWQTLSEIQGGGHAIYQSLHLAESLTELGPLVSWLRWLKERLIVYLYLSSNGSVLWVSRTLGEEVKEVSFILRSFFLSQFPEHEIILNDFFNIHSPIDAKSKINFSKIKQVLKLQMDFLGAPLKQELISELEVVLFPEWDKFIKNFQKLIQAKNQKRAFFSIRLKSSWWVDYLKMGFIFSVLAVLIVFGGLQLNIWYEKNLAKEVATFELNFDWLQKGLRLQPPRPNIIAKLPSETMESIKASDLAFEQSGEEIRYTPESDVMLSSVDDLPKGLEGAEEETSIYEEETKGDYRDFGQGQRKVYRLLMNSTDPITLVNKLSPLLEKHQITPIGNVLPGTKVPGGHYYNLYVPRENLKEFLEDAVKIGEGTLYENLSRSFNPPGQNRVFIWIKKI